MNIINIVLADDHTILREGLSLLIQPQPDMHIVCEASDGIKALDAVRQHRPDLLLIDIAMPNMNGLDATRLVMQGNPETKVIVLSRYEKEAYVHQSLDAGARGYVVKGSPGEELLEAIRTVNEGRYYLSPVVQASVIESYLLKKRELPESNDNESFSQLSDRERQVFNLLVAGNSSAEIGDVLCISSKTVDKHRSNIAKKIGTENPIKMMRFAAKIGAIDPTIWEE